MRALKLKKFILLALLTSISSVWAEKDFFDKQDQFTAAMNALRKKQFEQAEAILRPMLEVRPVNRKAWELMALVKARTEQYMRALKLTYFLIEHYHGDELLRKKGVKGTKEFLESAQNFPIPSKTILQYYFNMASYHTLQITKRFNSMREKDSFLLFKRHPKDEDYLIEQHFNLAEKHFFICDFFQFKNAQYENAKAYLADLEQKVRRRQDEPLLSLGGKHQLTSEFEHKGDLKNRKFYLDFFTEMFFWQEKLAMVHNQTQAFDLRSANLASCAGVQLSYRLEDIDVYANSCFFLGRSAIQSVEGSQLSYFDVNTRTRGAITGTGGFLRIGERFGVGIFTGHMYRHGFYNDPMRNLKIQKRRLHQFVTMVETRYEWKQLFLTQKIGYATEFSSALWSFGLHYRL